MYIHICIDIVCLYSSLFFKNKERVLFDCSDRLISTLTSLSLGIPLLLVCVRIYQL